MHAHTEKLRKVMRRHKLTSSEVADITNRSTTTVHIWRCKDDRRVIPAELLKLVELTADARMAGRKA